MKIDWLETIAKDFATLLIAARCIKTNNLLSRASNKFATGALASCPTRFVVAAPNSGAPVLCADYHVGTKTPFRAVCPSV
jgi:hypothetical protein